MALIKCRECQALISTKAGACPSCGARAKKKTSLFTWFVFLVVAVIIYNKVFSPDIKVTSDQASGIEEKNSTEVKGSLDLTSVAETKNSWSESSYVDKMTDETVKVFSIKSKNSVAFGFPYSMPGGSHLHLHIRQGGKTHDAFLKIDKGLMLCSYSSCGFMMRVNGGKPKKWGGLNSSSRDSDLMFVSDVKSLEKIVKAGGSVRIGIDFYKSGQQTFDFDLTGYPGK